MLTRLAAAAMLALAACGQPAPQPTQDIADPAATAPAPMDAAPRYVGLWAVSEEMCEDPPWRFEPAAISTQGEVHCDLSNVTAITGGYQANAHCFAEGTETDHVMRMMFAESAGGMIVENGPWAPAPGLIRCGPLPE